MVVRESMNDPECRTGSQDDLTLTLTPASPDHAPGAARSSAVAPDDLQGRPRFTRRPPGCDDSQN